MYLNFILQSQTTESAYYVEILKIEDLKLKIARDCKKAKKQDMR